MSASILERLRVSYARNYIYGDGTPDELTLFDSAIHDLEKLRDEIANSGGLQDTLLDEWADRIGGEERSHDA